MHVDSVILEATNYKQSHIFGDEMVASYCMQRISVASVLFVCKNVRLGVYSRKIYFVFNRLKKTDLSER